ncbi:hypothetical protein ACHAWF_006698 [Thalassiosira exigua]
MGQLPAISTDGNQYFFVAYDYDNNYVFAHPIANMKDATIVAAFQTIFQELKDKVHKPVVNVTDNQATRPLKAFLKTEDCRWQFVEPK